VFSAQYVALYIGFHAITLPFCLGDEKHYSVGIAPESRQILPIRVIATHDYFSHVCTVFAAQKFVPAVLTLGFESPTAFLTPGPSIDGTAIVGHQRGPILHRRDSEFRLRPDRQPAIALEESGFQRAGPLQ
jgi:hypothetical protein